MDSLPEKNNEYERLDYWNNRYAQEEESFEWCKSYTDFRHLIQQHVKSSDRILMLGCGNSALSEDMYLDGFTQITNIDYSPVVIENMKNKTTRAEHMKWMVMDITEMKFESESFDVVIEKATLDALLVSEKDPWQMSDSGQVLMDRILGQVSNLLSKNGRFISITFAQPHFRKRTYGRELYKWSVDVETFGNGFHFFFYIMTKGRTLAPDDCYVRQCQLLQQPVTFLQEEDHENFLNSIET